MILSEKQKSLIQDLQSQEKLCVEKYTQYESLARDKELKNLFGSIKNEEQQHYNSLSQLLTGNCPNVNTNDKAGMNYNPTPTYLGEYNKEDKEYDQFLCTDCITTEKYVSSAYNNDLFQFGEAEVRRLFNDIQTEEQNHAEKIYKYKTVNNMV
jgi:rubrerythrin